MILHQDPEKRPKPDAAPITVIEPYSKGTLVLKEGMYMLECEDGFYQVFYMNGERSHLRINHVWLDVLKNHIKK